MKNTNRNNAGTSVAIDCDFPGGNIIVESIDGREVRLHQDLRDTTRDWFYWCFRVRGAQGRSLRFVFTESPAIGVRGPAISCDRGKTWSWLGKNTVQDNTFACAFPPDVPEVRLSFAMPYQESHWREFVSGLDNLAVFSLHKLCTTRKGRDVQYMLAGCPAGQPLHRVAITCRHHCCEMMAGYALEGLIKWLVDDGGAEPQWMRDNVQLFIVPFVDKDGVEDGDQGKARHPRDHGRDYEGESLFASTGAIRRLIPDWGGDRLRAAFDLHCPWIRGPYNEVIYVVGSSDPSIASQQRRFSEILESLARGPLPFCAADFLPFGRAWNTSSNHSGGKGFSRWLAGFNSIDLAATIEIPYANVRGAEVNPESARRFGTDLGMAMSSYLQELQPLQHSTR